MKRKVLGMVAMALVCMSILAGCHTVKGAGEDIQSGGRAIERSTGQ